MQPEDFRRQRASYMRDWSERNRDRLLPERRLRYASDAEFAARHKRDSRVQVLRRRGEFDPESEDYLDIILEDPCCYCGCAVVRTHNRPDAAHIEHIDPAGSSHWSNLTVACCSCNAAKGKMPLLLSMLERSLRRDLTPIAEQVWLIKGREGQRRRIDF